MIIKCEHNRFWLEGCIKCDIVWHEFLMKCHTNGVNEEKAVIAELKRKEKNDL